MKRIFYKAVTKSAERLGFSRLASWAYAKWMRWWMDMDPDMGYYLFAEDYLGERIPLTPDGKIAV